MRVGGRHLLFALAGLVWAACAFGTLGLAGGVSSFCMGDGHYVPPCRSEREAILWLLVLGVWIGGAWLTKRLALRLGSILAETDLNVVLTIIGVEVRA
jgi:hypothetical protein